MVELKEELIKILKALDVYPKTGFGEVEIKININNGTIVNIVTKTSKKV